MMKDTFKTAAILVATFTFLTGLVYPIAVTVIARVAFPSASSGSLVVRDGKTIGSSLIGQSFTKAEYFHGRPSATSPVPCNASSSSGSNLGQLNPALREAVAGRVDFLRQMDPNLTVVPVDLVTASASGLDPHISPASANAQVARVAKARGKSEDELRKLVALHAEGRQFGLLGEPRVNVLLLNLALDEAKLQP